MAVPQLSCSAVCPRCAISSRQQFTHLGTTAPSTAHALPPPSRGLSRGGGEGGRELLHQAVGIVSKTEGGKKTSEWSFLTTLWALRMSDNGTCSLQRGARERKRGSFLLGCKGGRSAVRKCTDTFLLQTQKQWCKFPLELRCQPWTHD